jgi:hypothetical protein
MDSYKRKEVSPGVYQCGCKWERRDDSFGKGDVLVECSIHHQATVACVAKFERERK